MAYAIDPQTEAERQALTVLEAAMEVAARIEARRLTLRDAGIPDNERRRLKADLLEAAERLVNLLSLVLQRAREDLGAEMAAHIQGEVGGLRDRLLHASHCLVVDRAELVTKRAMSALAVHAGYPLGLGRKLREAMSQVEATVEVLGGAMTLPDQERQMLTTARQAVARLADYEGSLAVMQAVA